MMTDCLGSQLAGPGLPMVMNQAVGEQYQVQPNMAYYLPQSHLYDVL